MMAAPLRPSEARRLARLSTLPRALKATRRNRHVALVAAQSLAALTASIGVAAHRPAGLAAGLFMGAAVAVLHLVVEPQILRFEALGLWPPPSPKLESKT